MRSKIYCPRGRIKLSFFACALLAAMVFSGEIWGQDNRIRFNSSASIDWIREELNAQIDFNLAQAGVRLPTGRFMAEEILSEAYPKLLKPSLLSVKVDSNSNLKTLVDRGEVSLEDLDKLCIEAEKIPPNLSPDLSRMIGRYTVFLGKISAFLNRRQEAVEAPRVLTPVQTINYTGIIIIAFEELPAHGRRTQVLAEPCLFPKIWDTDMNLIYERNMFGREDSLMVRYAVPESIFRPTPSGLDGELIALVGTNPLRILAREVFGISPTDPVIDRADAMKILSSNNNRRLLAEGKVVLVLNSEKLRKNVLTP